MRTQEHHVRWTLPRWAAELILDTLKLNGASAGTETRLRKQIAAAVAAINQSELPIRQPTTAGFDLFRLSKSKETVDICTNTLRAYNKQGLPFYHRGKAIFVSKTELATFIMFAPYRSTEISEEED